MYWNPGAEKTPIEDLRGIQERKLKALVYNVYQYSPFYRKKFKEAGINPWDIKGLKDLKKLPFTKKPGEPVKVLFYSEEKYPLIRFHPAIKSLNYIGNMLAKKDAEKAGAFEPVFYNRDKIITECAIRNIFFIKGKTLITPGLDLGVLPGVMRDTIMDLAPQIGLSVVEDSIPFDSINEMEEAFISSTGIGLLSCYWEGWKSKFTMTNLLKKRLDAIITDHINND